MRNMWHLSYMFCARRHWKLVTLILLLFYLALWISRTLNPYSCSGQGGCKQVHGFVERDLIQDNRDNQLKLVDSRTITNKTHHGCMDVYLNRVIRHLKSGHLSPDCSVKLLQHDRLKIIYPTFNFTKPRFITNTDERLFSMNDESMQFLQPQVCEGTIAILRKGKIHPSIDCGTDSDLEQFKEATDETNVCPTAGILSPLLVPDGEYFQHFLDGVLPKISQIYDLIHDFNISIVLPKAVDSIVPEFLNELGILKEETLWYKPSMKSAWQLNSCKTPRMHPILWKRGRSLLGCKSTIPRQSKVILIRRMNTRNGGRMMLNQDEIMNLLLKRYKKQLVIFSGGLNFSESRNLFQRARIIIGVHGGGLYNINMAPSNATVIEIMPTDTLGYISKGLAHTMIWRMAQLLDQIYWRISANPVQSNVHVPVNHLLNILDVTDHFYDKNPG